MKILSREKYNEILKESNALADTSGNIIDIYHKNSWDHFIIHCDDNERNETPSYIDFFFDAKTMIDFLRLWLVNKDFKNCYIATIYPVKHKLKIFDDDVCKDIYSEFKILFNSLNVRVNTSNAIMMTKNEFLNWCDRFSIGGFSGVSEYSVFIPELDVLIVPHHHMNYLVYAGDKQKDVSDLERTLKDPQVDNSVSVHVSL